MPLEVPAMSAQSQPLAAVFEGMTLSAIEAAVTLMVVIEMFRTEAAFFSLKQIACVSALKFPICLGTRER